MFYIPLRPQPLVPFRSLLPPPRSHLARLCSRPLQASSSGSQSTFWLQIVGPRSGGAAYIGSSPASQLLTGQPQRFSCPYQPLLALWSALKSSCQSR